METVEKCQCDHCKTDLAIDDLHYIEISYGDTIEICEDCYWYFLEYHYYCGECQTYHPFEIKYRRNFFHYVNDFICPSCAMSKVSDREYFISDLQSMFTPEPIIIDENKFLPNELSRYSLVTTFAGVHTISSDHPALKEIVTNLIEDGFYYEPAALVWGYDHGYYVKLYVDFSCREDNAEKVNKYTNDYQSL